MPLRNAALLVAFLFSQISFSASQKIDRRSFFSSPTTVNIEMVNSFREEVKQRREEILDVLTRVELRDKGTNNSYTILNNGIIEQNDFLGKMKAGFDNVAARTKAQNEDEIRSFDILLELVDQLAAMANTSLTATDKVEADTLAQKITSLSFALKQEGLRPAILIANDWLKGILHEWKVDVKVPVEREAINLYDFSRHQFYTTAELKELKAKGFDLSKLDPAPNSVFWKSTGEISKIDAKDYFYGGKAPLQRGLKVVFPENNEITFERIKQSQTTPKMNIRYVVGGKTYKGKFKVGIGKDMFSDATSSVLFSLVGYHADISKYVRDIKIYFKEGTDLTLMKKDWYNYYMGISGLSNARRYDIENHIKDTGKDEKGSYVTFKEGVIEVEPEGILRVGAVDYNEYGVSKYREARAYALFNLWLEQSDWQIKNGKLAIREKANGEKEFFLMAHDLGCGFGGLMCEKLDRYRYQPVSSVSSKEIVFDYRSPNNQPMQNEATYNDFKWGARLMAQLTRKQIEDAVEAGGWPKSLQKVLVEKIISRRNEFVKVFGLLGEEIHGQKIAEIPINKHITTEDGVLMNGEIMVGKVPGYEADLSGYWDSLIWNGVINAAKTITKGAIVGGLCGLERMSIDPAFVGLSEGVILESLSTTCRDNVKNPKPTSDKDIWLIRDTVKLGLRLGAGVGAAAEVDIVKKFTLVRGAPTILRGMETNEMLDMLVDFELPFKIRRGDLPSKFVIIREDYLVKRGRFRSSEVSKTIIGGEFLDEEVLLSRNIISKKDGDNKIILYKDKSIRNDVAAKLIADLGLTRTTFVRGNKTLHGGTSGEAYMLDLNELNDEKSGEYLSNVIKFGDFQNVELVNGIKKAKVDSQILNASFLSINLFGFYMNDMRKREDVTTVTTQDSARQIYKNEYVNTSGYNLLGIAELDDVRVRGYEVRDKGTGKADNLVVVSFLMSDTDTLPHELENGYIKFLNGLSETGKLKFTAKNHTWNDRFGPTETRALLHYQPAALEMLMNLKEETFIRYFAARQGNLAGDVFRAWAEYYAASSAVDEMRVGMSQLTKLPANLEKSLRRIKSMFRVLGEARNLRGEAQVRKLTQAVRKMIYGDKAGESFDPVLFSAVNSFVGDDKIYLTRSIVTPFDIENAFPGKKGLFWPDVGTPQSYELTRMVLFPEDILEIWHMFDWLK